MKKFSKYLSRVLVVILLLGVTLGTMGSSGGGCDQKQVSSSGAEQRSSIKIPLNSKGNTVEQQNIQDRINVTMSPTKVMWIHLISLDGKIVRRMPVRCKVTSSGKRLEPKQAADGLGTYPSSPFEISNDNYWSTNEFIQPDGTYGESDNYIFWFDPQGRYHQWGTAGGLGYLMTDYPIDLANPIDDITGMYNMNQAAHEWQKQQEAELKKQEDK